MLEGHGLPKPLRIPDSWETSTLIHPQLSRLLKDLRGRCPLLTDLSYGRPTDGSDFIASLEGT